MSKYDKLREERAKIILSKEAAITKVKHGLYTVQSQTGVGRYRVESQGDHWTCNCPDYTKNGGINRPCKHILALNMYLKTGHPIVFKNQEEPKKIERVTYSQDWANYNHAQSMEIELFDNFLCQLVSTIDEQEPQGRGRPGLRLTDRLFCCIMKSYSQLSSRRSQCLFHQALQRSQISHSPHYNAISKTLLQKEITPILHELVRKSALPLAGIETDFAIDSSGFRCSSFDRYYEYMYEKRREHHWLKAHICTGVKTNIVTDVVVTDEDVGDCPQFKTLIEKTAKGFDINEVTADKAYSARKNLAIVKKLGGTAYIPFKENTSELSRGSMLWVRSYHFFQLHRDEFDEHYHKRSNAESTFAAIKKKFGERIKSKNRVAQENELLCKIIAYNLTVLIHETIQLDTGSEILSFAGLQTEQPTEG